MGPKALREVCRVDAAIDAARAQGDWKNYIAVLEWCLRRMGEP